MTKRNKDLAFTPFELDITWYFKESIDKIGLSAVLEKLSHIGGDGKHIDYYGVKKSSDGITEISDIRYDKIKVGHGLFMRRYNKDAKRKIIDIVRITHKYGGVIFFEGTDGVRDFVYAPNNLPKEFYAMKYIKKNYIKLAFKLPKIVEIVNV